MFETVSTPHFYFPAVVARATAVAAESRGLPLTPLTIALLVLSMAYRTIPTSQPWYTTIAFFNPIVIPPRPEYYWLPGHNFGLASAVVNFNRYPEFVVVIARAALLVPCDHYYDDFLVPDLDTGGSTARHAIEQLVLMLGSGAPRHPLHPIRSPEIDPDKTKPTGPVHSVLGVITDLSQAASPTPTVSFSVDPDRV